MKFLVSNGINANPYENTSKEIEHRVVKEYVRYYKGHEKFIG